MSNHSILSAVFNKNIISENSVVPTNTNRSLDHRDFINRQMLSREVPIQASESTWETFQHTDHESIQKVYSFQNFDHLLYFVNEVLISSKRIGHDPIVRIDHDQVEVKLYTKDINEVTEIDIRFSKIVDEIFEDIFYVEAT